MQKGVFYALLLILLHIKKHTMATALLKFDLADHEDKMEFKRMTSANEMAFFIWDLMLNIKSKIAQEIENSEDDGKWVIEAKIEALDLIFQRINELYDEHDIQIENLIN
jgi:hypothetical protein